MKSVRDVFSWLGGTRFSDVIFPGYLDREGERPEFRPWEETVYLVGEEGLLRLDSVAGHGQLRLDVVSDLEVPEVFVEEGLEFATASLGNQFFLDALSWYECTRIRYVVDQQEQESKISVKCAEFEYNEMYTVFADPEWHFGIRLGGVVLSSAGWTTTILRTAPC